MILFKAIDLLEESIFTTVDLETIATKCNISQSYLIRVFKQKLGLTPIEYLKRRRLGYAAIDIINTEMKVIDISLDYEYNSPEAFTRAFKKFSSVNPKEYRKRGILPAFGIYDEKSSERIKSMTLNFNPKAKIQNCKEIELRGYCIKTSILQSESSSGEADYKTCVFIDNHLDPTLLGMKDSYRIFLESPNGDSYYRVPGGEYAIFEYKNPGDWLLEAYRYIWSVWLPQSNYIKGDGVNYIISNGINGKIFIPLGSITAR